MITNKQQLFPGVWKYSKVFDPQKNLVGRLEKTILDSNEKYKWEDASVGHDEIILDYRTCKDFKLGSFSNKEKDEYIKEFDSIWKDLCEEQRGPVEDYCNMYNIQMNFWEWINVVKYGPGDHFKEHADHGWSYVSTVSLVGYPNDDYVGGELYFPKLNLNIKPEAGDLYIFPSTYLFSHVALPVKEGLKYSFVTMLDYNDDTHTEEYEDYIKEKYKKENNATKY